MAQAGIVQVLMDFQSTVACFRADAFKRFNEIGKIKFTESIIKIYRSVAAILFFSFFFKKCTFFFQTCMLLSKSAVITGNYKLSSPFL